MQSIRDKIDELRIMAKERKPCIIAAAETWLDASHNDHELFIENFNLVRRDRAKDPNRGGVAIYYRNDLEISTISLNPHPSTCKCENLWIKVQTSICRIFILGIIYRSHSNNNFLEHITSDLESIAAMNYPILIIGDFNIDLSRNSAASTEYHDIMSSFLLKQLIDQPTRVTETSATLIDHIWTSNEELVNYCTLLPGLSDHHICSAGMKLYTKNKKLDEFTTRSFRGLNKEHFHSDLQEVDWAFIDELEDINLIWEQWHSNFLQILDHHAPMKKFKRNKNDSPWMNSQILTLVQQKKEARISRDNDPNTATEANYKRYKSLVKSKVTAAKRNYYRNKAVESKDNPQKMWNVIKEAAPSNFKHKGKNNSTEADPDEFNDYFVNVGCDSQSPPCYETESQEEHEAVKIELIQATEQQVLNIIKKFPVHKSPGHDGISGRALRLAMPVMLSPITRLVNKMITTQEIPQDFKLAVVTPIHKSGDKKNPVNYRPISVLPLISKIIERIVADQLMHHLESNNLLTNMQYGFRKGHSTNTCLLQLTEEIRNSLDNKKAVGILALDLSKAFDSIDHELLLGKLPSFGISEHTTTYKFLRNYLRERKQSETEWIHLI